MNQELERLNGALDHAIADGSIGIPRFLRCMVVCGGVRNPQQWFAELLELTNRLFGGSPPLRFPTGNGDDTIVGELMRWTDGRAALLSVFPGGVERTATIDLMLIGSKGVLYHEEGYPDEQ